MDTWLNESVDGDARPVAPLSAVGVMEREKAQVQDQEADGIDGDGAPKSSLPVQDLQEPAGNEGRLERLLEAATQTELPSSKVATLRAILKGMRDSIDNALKLIEAIEPDAQPAAPAAMLAPVQRPVADESADIVVEGERLVEGVFDGQNMVGGDGKSYSVPPNYASKSKLVEGDMLKLTISPRGNFIYKQIGPIERQRVVGAVSYEQDSGQHVVLAGGRTWRVLKASITYFHADVSDEAVILVPKNAPSRWAAVENIIKKNPTQRLDL